MVLTELPMDRLAEFKDKFPPVTDIDIKKLSDLGGRSPLVSYLLLQAQDHLQALDSIADYLLEVAPPGSNHKRIREAFEALCLLDQFREGEMDVMLKEYYRLIQTPSSAAPDLALISSRKIRDELLSTNLFFWEGDGYRIDVSLRTVLRNYLRISQNPLWVGLNRAANEIYTGYAENFPQYKSDYQKLAQTYKDALVEANA